MQRAHSKYTPPGSLRKVCCWSPSDSFLLITQTSVCVLTCASLCTCSRVLSTWRCSFLEACNMILLFAAHSLEQACQTMPRPQLQSMQTFKNDMLLMLLSIKCIAQLATFFFKKCILSRYTFIWGFHPVICLMTRDWRRSLISYKGICLHSLFSVTFDLFRKEDGGERTQQLSKSD